MESTASLVNWHDTNKLKCPGMHFLSSMQGLAHGADSVLYFQWRKGRGDSEKFHGAVVDHCGHKNTRVFREVSEVGASLNKLKEIQGSTAESKVAIIYDVENKGVVDDLQGLKKYRKRYEETAEVLGVYKSDFYADMPAVTVNNYGKGKAYYIAARAGEDFNTDFYLKLVNDLEIKSIIDGKLPKGVTTQMRSNEDNKYTFIMNFTEEEKIVLLGKKEYVDMLSGEKVIKEVILEKYEIKILGYVLN